jgi:hypothetical protein
MDQRSVRERHEVDALACKPEASRASSTRRRAGRAFGTHDRARVPAAGGRPLRAASAVAVTRGACPRSSRETRSRRRPSDAWPSHGTFSRGTRSNASREAALSPGAGHGK